ncbi:hypothetical protein BHE74_00044604 [Ensete ventricosum]|nr:hypothetical protein BHE74_00044604 [Ensete ventricosum]
MPWRPRIEQLEAVLLPTALARRQPRAKHPAAVKRAVETLRRENEPPIARNVVHTTINGCDEAAAANNPLRNSFIIEKPN